MILVLKHLLKRLSFEVPFYAILFVCSNHIIITLKNRLLTARITVFHLFYWIQGKHGKEILLRSFEIGFQPIIWGLSAPTPRIWYVSPFAKPRGRDLPFRANSKISYKVGNWHSSPSLRRETAAVGPSFLAAVTTTGRPDYRIQDIHASLGCW